MCWDTRAAAGAFVHRVYKGEYESALAYLRMREDGKAVNRAWVEASYERPRVWQIVAGRVQGRIPERNAWGQELTRTLACIGLAAAAADVRRERCIDDRRRIGEFGWEMVFQEAMKVRKDEEEGGGKVVEQSLVNLGNDFVSGVWPNG